jgi:uncharacterized Rmd1/YagE family protein
LTERLDVIADLLQVLKDQLTHTHGKFLRLFSSLRSQDKKEEKHKNDLLNMHANPSLPTGEYLEWIVIVLIAAEIVVAAINILVDLYAGVD